MPRCPACQSPVSALLVWRSFDCLIMQSEPVRCLRCRSVLVPVRSRARVAVLVFGAVTLAGFEGGRALGRCGFGTGMGIVAGTALAWILAVAGITLAGSMMRYRG